MVLDVNINTRIKIKRIQYYNNTNIIMLFFSIKYFVKRYFSRLHMYNII